MTDQVISYLLITYRNPKLIKYSYLITFFSLDFKSFFKEKAVLGFEFRVSCFLSRYSTTWSMFNPFYFHYFGGLGLLFYAWAGLDSDLPVSTSHITGMTGMCHNTQLFFIMWYPELFTEAGLKL
jgi:hypothetical protein